MIRDTQATAAKKPPPTPTEPQSESVTKRKPIEETKSKPELQQKPSAFKRLYTAVADATQRTYAKARSVFDRKERLDKPVERKAPRRSMATAPVNSAATPAKKEFAAKRDPVKQDERQPLRETTREPKTASLKKPPVPASTNQDRDKGQKRDIKPRLSREELDLMIGRQRQQREERRGPSR